MKEVDQISLPDIRPWHEVVMVGVLLILPVLSLLYFGWYHNSIFTTWRHSRTILCLWGAWGWLLALYVIYIRRIADWLIVCFFFKGSPSKKRVKKQLKNR